MNFKQPQAGGRVRGAHGRVRRFHQRRLPHAARAPQQRVICWQAAREAFGILDQQIAHAIDALKKRHLDPIDAGDRHKPPPFRVPDKGVGGGKIRRCRGLRRKSFKRGGDAKQNALGGAALRRFVFPPVAGGFCSRLDAGAMRFFGHVSNRFAPSISGARKPLQACRQTLQLGRCPL